MFIRLLIFSTSVVLAFVSFAAFNTACTHTPGDLVADAVAAVGGPQALHSLQDVEYEYTYRTLADSLQDVSLERYVFDGERSWAKYTTREKYALVDLPGELVQGYNGQESWCTLDGGNLDDPMALKMSDFARKTNYYWFTMIFKLLDPGLSYTSLGKRVTDGVNYDVVEVTFGEDIGDVQDTYVLYINPETHLIDRFLFTVMDFKMAKPHLMLVEYEEIEGLKLPVRRKYAPADWEGNIVEETWAEELSTNIKFNNGFALALFDRPEEAVTSMAE